MSIWCECKLEIEGNGDENDECLDFNNIYPCPYDFEKKKKEYVNWCHENWGCFSVGFYLKYYHCEDELLCYFMTKWFPPDRFSHTCLKSAQNGKSLCDTILKSQNIMAGSFGKMVKLY